MRTVYILDDHRLFSNGLELMLRTTGQDLECRAFENPADMLAEIKAAGQAPNLMIVDFYIPGANAPDLIADMTNDHPDCPIMVVSASINPADKRQALAAGASMFVNKASDPQELIDAITSLLEGGDVAETPDDAIKVLSARFNLTPRQLEILVLVSKGCTNKEIARLLELSPETVKSHLRDIFLRFGVNNRIEAIDFARSNGLA
jgi:DNA-binding NarL/FixJ family response regulator